jgi:hypothetical protein
MLELLLVTLDRQVQLVLLDRELLVQLVRKVKKVQQVRQVGQRDQRDQPARKA